MAGKRERHKERTRQAILDAALRLFGQQGYERTSITDLAQAAGIGKATVYSYFRTKGEIFLAFCEAQLETVRTVIVETDVPAMPILDRLLAVYGRDLDFLLDNPEIGRMLMRETFFPGDPDPRTPSRRLGERYIALLAPLLLQAQARGQLRRDVELTLVLGHFYGLYCMVVSAWFTGRLITRDDVFMALEALFEQALQGLAPRAGTDNPIPPQIP